MKMIFRVNDENGNMIDARNSVRIYTHALVVPVLAHHKDAIVPGHYEVASYFGTPELAERGLNHPAAKRARKAGGEPKIVPVVQGTNADLREATAKHKANNAAARKLYDSLQKS